MSARSPSRTFGFIVPPPHIPLWALFLARFPTRHNNTFALLIRLGFWDVAEGDWYVRGHWCWRCWEPYEVLYRDFGITAPLPFFPRMMRRIFHPSRAVPKENA